MKVTQKLKQYLVDEHGMPPTLTDLSLYAYRAAELLADNVLSAEKLYDLLSEEPDMATTSPSPTKVFETSGNNIRVKDPSERYSEKRYDTQHAKLGTIVDPISGREVMTMSEASKARAGVLLKHVARRCGIDATMSDHERELLSEVAIKQRWCGSLGGDHYDDIDSPRVKALLDESGGSQGLEIVPIEFDSDVISFPLLTGELYPTVDIRPVARGRRIEGASIGTPTLAWGGGDNTEISLFNTASLVSAIDTTIHTCDGAVEIGRDFLSDSPVDVGGTLTRLIGERLANELDDVIANGNGTTQPEGIFSASALSTVAWGGSTSIGNYETLLFGIGKQYRAGSSRCIFLGNDTSYQRARSIPVGASDARRIFGMDHENYTLFSRPYRIQNDVANTKVAFGNMSKYRMYRRLGLELRFETAGNYLAKRNLALLVYRARFGGRIMDTNAFCKTTTAPA